jgi:hypothetical protein
MKPALLATALALSGCASLATTPWWPAEPSFVARHAGFEVAPPPGWMRFTPAREVLLVTRDGTPLQRIVVGATRLGEPLGLGDGKRAVRADMSPQELAELVVDDMLATEGVGDVRVLENAPATLSGRSGFRVVASFRGETGLVRRLACYGVVEGSRFYRIAYLAPERLYFDRDRPAFEEVARSFRLRPPVPERPSRRRPAR